MEVNLSYIENLFNLLNDNKFDTSQINKEEFTINSYITLLSLSNLEYTEKNFKNEQEQINDFLRKLNNLKVKIQLNGKKEHILKFKEELLTQYYENINFLSLYIKNNDELVEIINTLDAKKITKEIDSITKNKNDKESKKEIYQEKRNKIVKLLPHSNYYIANNKIYIENNNNYEEIEINEFKEIFNYLLNTNNFKLIYKTKTNQISRELIINNLIKTLISNDLTENNLEKILIPLVFTKILSLNIDEMKDLDNSSFNVENIKISELYSLASNTNTGEFTAKWRNIKIPNEYLIEKIKEIISKGMYYYKEDKFILDNPGEFTLSIKITKIKHLLKTLLESNINCYKQVKKNK